jgi:N-acetyl-D-muramate 6-phosphate phosphatase
MTRAAAPCRGVLFDLDGTLLDTAPDMVAALNALRAEHGVSALPFAHARARVSHGSVALVRLGFPRAPEGEFETLRQRFLDLYAARIAEETVPFPGMEQLLGTLEANRIPWGIVTNKPGWLTERLLEALGLRRRAASVVSGDTFPERKPHPRPVLAAAAELGVAAEQCLFVGDAERDVQAALAARMTAIVALFGYLGPADRVAEWQAHGCIDTPLEVLDWVARPGAMPASSG